MSNVRARLVDQGSGPPCLLLHGNPDTADLWRGVISHLEADHRCLAPDLPGFGASVVTGDLDCSLRSMSAFVDELLAAAGVDEPVDLVVHDFGGPYGLSWAVEHPEKVRRLVLLDTLYFADYRWHFWARLWRTPLVGELTMLLMNRWIFAWELRRGSRGLDPAHVREVYSRVHPAMKKMVLRLYRATDPEVFAGWEERLLALTAEVPTLVLWGGRDPYIPARYAERFGADRVRIFPDCGHWLPVEASEDVGRELRSFLA